MVLEIVEIELPLLRHHLAGLISLRIDPILEHVDRLFSLNNFCFFHLIDLVVFGVFVHFLQQ